MISKTGLSLFMLILSVSLPRAQSAQSSSTIDKFSAGDWTGTANSLDGRFAYCTIMGPLPSTSMQNQLGFMESSDGKFSILLEELHPPPAKCPDGGFMGSGLCNTVTGGPMPSATPLITTVDVRLGVAADLKDMRSYKGTQFSHSTVIVDLPVGDDLMERIKTAHYLNGAIPSMQTLFLGDLGASRIPMMNSAAYAAINALRNCVASHNK
jgi:hypothetical protein